MITFFQTTGLLSLTPNLLVFFLFTTNSPKWQLHFESGAVDLYSKGGVSRDNLVSFGSFR